VSLFEAVILISTLVFSYKKTRAAAGMFYGGNKCEVPHTRDWRCQKKVKEKSTVIWQRHSEKRVPAVAYFLPLRPRAHTSWD